MPEAEVDRFSGKVIGLLGIGVIAAWIFGYAFRTWFASPTGGEFMALIGFAGIALTIFGVTAFVVKGTQVFMAAALLQIAAIWSSLEGKFGALTLLGLLALFVFLFAGFKRARMDIADAIKIRFFRIAYRAVSVATTGFVLFGTLYLLGTLNMSQATFHKGTIEFLLKVSESTVKEVIPGFSGEQSVDAVLRSIIVAQAGEGIGEAEIQLNIKAMKERITDSTGFQLTGRERVSDAVYEMTLAKISRLAPAYQILMLIVAGIIIFGLVKGFALFLNLAVIFLAFLAYQSLIALGFMTIKLESASKEIIVLE